MADVHYFGIRHHGPGSARHLIRALEKVRPSVVLIEGPADCSDLISMLAQKTMIPPVALLCYSSESPDQRIYYPFTEYSPEYQAILWAVDHGAEVRWIDLPIAQKLVISQPQEVDNVDDDTAEQVSEDEVSEDQDSGGDGYSDPIGILAQCAGYEDGEAWWNDWIEQNSDNDLDVFHQVETVMTTLRASEESAGAARNESNFLREAFMRRAIAKEAKDATVAVITGAWHTPALKEKHTAKDDNALLKSLPRKLPGSKVRTTWIPWTSPRLSSASGYGAGVAAPMWYQHLWQYKDNPAYIDAWVINVSRALREKGHIVSTASAIEAVRLSHSLAHIRNRPSPGFEEIREAIISCLCFGESVVWQQIEDDLLLGNLVGEIPAETPLAPLLEDLQRLQKKLKIKPEALPKELSLDLRSESGGNKSVLLHRLTILGVSWGQPRGSGSSRGTFRENWLLQWKPEYAVQLLDNLIYGNTIEQAAGTKILTDIAAEKRLDRLAELIHQSLNAQLDETAEQGLGYLDRCVAQVSDSAELMKSIPPLVTLARYGTARKVSLEHIHSLTERLTTQAIVALPYDCRNLNSEEASHYCELINSVHQAVLIAEMKTDVTESWWQVLLTLSESPVSTTKVRGLTAQLCYLGEKMPVERLQILLERNMSAAIPVAESAAFFEGFFNNCIDRLVYDDILRECVKDWLGTLDEDSFIECLPLLRRVFSTLDSMERKRLSDAIFSGCAAENKAEVIPAQYPAWLDQAQRLGRLINGDKQWI